MKKITFWDTQARKGELSGTQDRYAKELEMAAIARYVKDGMRVLDVGCGDGETALFLARKYPKLKIDGIDYSKEMIDAANFQVDMEESWLGGCRIYFWEQDIRDGLTDFRGKYDLIYTQRALINLDTWEEQRQAILDILSLLKPGGTYVMVECFQEGLQEINELRLKVGLKSIVPPWHNRYLREDEIIQLLWDKWKEDGALLDPPTVVCDKTEYFSGAYYFMSRVVNAWYAKQELEDPEYDHPLNRLGTLLPPGCVNLRGQVQAWIIKKKEGK